MCQEKGPDASPKPLLPRPRTGVGSGPHSTSMAVRRPEGSSNADTPLVLATCGAAFHRVCSITRPLSALAGDNGWAMYDAGA